MENNITVNMENLSEDERNILLELIAKANKPKNKVWEPKDNEEYYFFYSNGEIDYCYCRGDGDDKNRYLIGNCFKTKEEAEFVVEKLKVIAELKRFAEENNEHEIDWSDYKAKYIIYYNYDRCVLSIAEMHTVKYSSTTYFSSKRIAQEAINKIGEDRLKKYYFEVED